MSGLFIKKDDTINVKIYLAQNQKNETIFAIKKEEMVQQGIKEEDIKEETIEFRRPSYSDNVQIMNKAVNVQDGNVHIDPVVLRYNRFCTLLKAWTLKDKDGQPIPANTRFINEMNPDFANLILDELENFI